MNNAPRCECGEYTHNCDCHERVDGVLAKTTEAPEVPAVCEGCYSGREGRYFHFGIAMCWVCRWVRQAAPLWAIPIVDWIDHKGGKEKP
jgi:hypothetical protein